MIWKSRILHSKLMLVKAEMGRYETRKDKIEGSINGLILPLLKPLLNIYLVNQRNSHILCEGIAGRTQRRDAPCGDLHAVAPCHQQRAVWRQRWLQWDRGVTAKGMTRAPRAEL